MPKYNTCASVARKEGNVLFNDALNTFYLRLYGIEHMLKDHSDSERKPAADTTSATFSISSKTLFYMHHPTDRIAHTMAFVILCFRGVRIKSTPMYVEYIIN